MATELPHPGSTFNNIYTQYYRKSFLFVKSYVYDDIAAEDIASEALIKLWQWMQRNPTEIVGPMLLSILKNKALDYLRHESIKQQALTHLSEKQQEDLALRLSSLEECNPNEIFSKEVTGIIRDTLESLPEQTSRIFSLSRFEGKTNREIAAELHISVKNVEYHISKALKVFRKTLKDYLPLFYFFFYLK
ncbi:RNA polymerase sigma-70 factor [uncultured Bacteroides sp.]|uniref:RNA polymerase sigma-70 factor n=1 Tax=uncultured Bacteroides sp. TaxID=162156 RepID=UPI0025D9C563|nr:RNA polymerase sigma-70 factor [uncultured Bacteroides sp.]